MNPTRTIYMASHEASLASQWIVYLVAGPLLHVVGPDLVHLERVTGQCNTARGNLDQG